MEIDGLFLLPFPPGIVYFLGLLALHKKWVWGYVNWKKGKGLYVCECVRMFVREEVRLCFESCAGEFLKLLAKEEQRDESTMSVFYY